MTTRTSTGYSADPASVSSVEDFPGYDPSLGFFIEPGERLLDRRCPECGASMLLMPMGGLLDVTDCPWCMNHREPGDEPEAMFDAGFPCWDSPDHSHDGDLSAHCGLWICGPGATRKACSVARAWRDDNGGSVRYVTEFDLFSMHGDDVQRLYANGLVAIDALGVSNPSTWGLSKLCAVLYERANRRKPTILCSAFAPSKVVAKYEQADEMTAIAFKESVRRMKGVQA